MRLLILPTCLALSAWAQPAGTVFENAPIGPLPNTTVVAKATNVTLDVAPAVSPEIVKTAAANAQPVVELSEPVVANIAAPAETTEEVVQNGESAAEPVDDNAEPEAAPVEAEAPRIPLPPRRAVPHRVVCEALAEAAQNNNVPTPFLIRLIWQESRFNQNAVSPVGAQGVAQFMPETAARKGLLDPFNPLQAVRASARLLSELFHQFGNFGLAAAAYNAGPKRVADWLGKHGKLPQETQNYVQRITGQSAENWRGKTAAAQIRVPPQAPCQQEAGLYASNGPTHIPLPPTPHSGQSPDSKTPETRIAAKRNHSAEKKSQFADATVATHRHGKLATTIIAAETHHHSKTAMTKTAATKIATQMASKTAAKTKIATNISVAKSPAKQARHAGTPLHGKKVQVAEAGRGRK